MKALQLEKLMEHSGGDWIDTRILAVSDDSSKLEKLAASLTEESILFYEQHKEICYSRSLKLNTQERHIEIMRLHSTFENISKYGIYCEIDGTENVLKIVDVEVI